MKAKKTLYGMPIKSVKFTACERYDAALQARIKKFREIKMSLYDVFKIDDPELLDLKKEIEALTDAEFYYYIMLQRIY